MARFGAAITIFGIVVSASVAAAPAALAAENIDTTPSWSGTSSVRPWSPDGSQTYGQIITPQLNGSLTDFTFYINPDYSSPDIQYQARVYQWDYTGGPGVWGPTGPSLFNSGTLSFAGTPGDFSEVNIQTGGVPVDAGIPYVLFFSTVGEVNPLPNATSWGFIFADVYDGGDFVFSNDSSSYTTPWDSFFGTGTELAFKANILPVPGPIPLIGVASAFGFSRRIRRRLAARRP